MPAPASISVVHHYLRPSKRFPLVWCAGCGNGIVLGALLRAIDEVGLDRDMVAMVSGIGCSSRAPTYVDFNTLHTTHGRAIAFATGIKLAKPELTVIVATGDGDAAAIGGNHFIHAARRNIDLKVIVFNNYIYGMTGGQYSPTTNVGDFATTAPYGNVERPFDICELAAASGASFVARSTCYHATHLENMIAAALRHKGFCVVDAITQCPTYFGRLNKLGSPVDMLKWQKDTFLTADQYNRLSPEERQGKFVRGILVQREQPEYTELYEQLVRRVQGLPPVAEAKEGEEKCLKTKSESKSDSPAQAVRGSS